MAKIGVCIEPFFTSLPAEERIEKIAGLGYTGVEFWHRECTWSGTDLTGPAKNAEKIKAALDKCKVVMADILLNAWDASLGGSLVNSQERKMYLENLDEVIEFAKSIGCNRLITLTGKEISGTSRVQQLDNIISTLSEAAEVVKKEGFTLLLEPLNSYVDHPGYFLDSAKEAIEIVRQINHPNVRLLYDIYHMQIMEGNVISTIEKNIDIIEHFHVAGVPGRVEPFLGELNYSNIIEKIYELGYDGYIGLEYFPSMDSEESLKRTREHLPD